MFVGRRAMPELWASPRNAWARRRHCLPERAEREVAIRELLRGRLGISGPTTAAPLAASLGVPEPDVEQRWWRSRPKVWCCAAALRPVAPGSALEWCDRRLLARIHRYTLNRLRAEIEPVSAADFMRFLFAWQRVDPDHRAAGLEGLAAVIEQLDGSRCPPRAWESDVLAARCEEYDPGCSTRCA